MNKSSGISYIKGSDRQNTEQDSSNQAKIELIRSTVTRDLLDMLHSMFDGIDDSFFELANNAKTNNEQNQFFEAMRDIRIKRKSIEKDFTDKLTALFSSHHVFSKPAYKDELQSKFANFESLSLVQNDDLEEDVAITSMSNKAASNFQGPLLQFHARIGKLYGASNLKEIHLPLDPKDISKAFSEACSSLEIQLKERLIVYKQFDRYVLSNLGSLLEDINKTLIRFGIMPDLKTPGIRQKHSPKGEMGSSSITHDNKPTTNSSPKSQLARNVLPELHSLLANIRFNHANVGEPNQLDHSTEFSTKQEFNTQLVETKDLISLLTAIQNIPPPESSASINHQAKVLDIHSELKNELNRHSSQPRKPAFKQVDEDLINLVSMLFEFILDDYNLAAPIQVLISRLQIPILKVVIKDNSFFSSKKHPARQLLNALAKSGIGWTESKNNSHDNLYKKIHLIVHTILDEFTGEISLFDKLNREFDEFIQKENKKSKIVELRTKEAEIGQVKSRQAQKMVEETLTKLTSNTLYPIPEIIRETLKNGWSRVMFLAFLKDEQEHQWYQSCQTAENLIWCLQPLQEQRERQRWITIAPKLLKELKSGLEEVSYNTSGLEKTILNIRTVLTNAFKNSSYSSNIYDNVNIEQKSSSIFTKTKAAKKSAVEKQITSKKTGLSQYLTRISQLRAGTWLEFLLLNGNKYRCKLSTIIEETESYIFVNRMGLKTVEKSKHELAEDLRKDQVVILEQGLMVDRALNALTSNLRQKAGV